MGYEQYPNPKYDDQCCPSQWPRSCIDEKGVDEGGRHQEVTLTVAHSGRVYPELMVEEMNKIMATIPMLSWLIMIVCI